MEAVGQIKRQDGQRTKIIGSRDSGYISVGTEETVMKTWYTLSSGQDFKVHFAVRGSDGLNLSGTPTTLDFTAVSELDQTPPKHDYSYINKAKDRIFLYFNERLDEASIPDASAFTLSSGTIANVEIENKFFYDRYYGVVKLTLTQAIDNISALTVSYTRPGSGNVLKDDSINGNEAVNITGKTVTAAAVTVASAVASNDGKYIKVIMNNDSTMTRDAQNRNLWGYYPNNSSISYGAIGSLKVVNYSDFSSDSYGNEGQRNMWVSYTIENPPATVDNGVFSLRLVPFQQVTDYAEDALDVIEVQISPNAGAESATVKSAVWNSASKELTVTFQEGPKISNHYAVACNFQIVKGEKTHYLMGWAEFPKGDISQNKIVFRDKQIPFDTSNASNWTDAKIKYDTTSHSSMPSWGKFSFPSGKPYDGFVEFRITQQ